MHWLLFVAQGMVPQVFFAVGLVVALVAEHLIMSCLVLPDSFGVLCKWNFVRAYVALEVSEINFCPCFLPFSKCLLCKLCATFAVVIFFGTILHLGRSAPFALDLCQSFHLVVIGFILFLTLVHC